MLMNNPNIEVDETVLKAYSDVVSKVKLKIGKEENYNSPAISEIIVAMQKLDYAQYEICDMLVKDMFKEHTVFKDRRFKEFFFNVYGDIVYENILANKPKYGYVCVDCGVEISKVNGKCRCAECQRKYRIKYNVQGNRIRRSQMIASENI